MERAVLAPVDDGVGPRPRVARALVEPAIERLVVLAAPDEVQEHPPDGLVALIAALHLERPVDVLDGPVTTRDRDHVARLLDGGGQAGQLGLRRPRLGHVLADGREPDHRFLHVAQDRRAPADDPQGARTRDDAVLVPGFRCRHHRRRCRRAMRVTRPARPAAGTSANQSRPSSSFRGQPTTDARKSLANVIRPSRSRIIAHSPTDSSRPWNRASAAARAASAASISTRSVTSAARGRVGDSSRNRGSVSIAGTGSVMDIGRWCAPARRLRVTLPHAQRRAQCVCARNTSRSPARGVVARCARQASVSSVGSQPGSTGCGTSHVLSRSSGAPRSADSVIETIASSDVEAERRRGAWGSTGADRPREVQDADPARGVLLRHDDGLQRLARAMDAQVAREPVGIGDLQRARRTRDLEQRAGEGRVEAEHRQGARAAAELDQGLDVRRHLDRERLDRLRARADLPLDLALPPWAVTRAIGPSSWTSAVR